MVSVVGHQASVLVLGTRYLWWFRPFAAGADITVVS